MGFSAYSLSWETEKQLEFHMGIYYVRYQQLILLLVPNAKGNDGTQIINNTIFASKEAGAAIDEFWAALSNQNLSDGFRQVAAYLPADKHTFLSRSELRSLTERRRLVPEPEPRRTDRQMQDETADELHKLLLCFEKVARRVASKDPRDDIADVRTDDAWSAFFHLPADESSDDRFEAGHIIFQILFMNWYNVMRKAVGAFFDSLEGRPPPMFVLLHSLHVGKDTDEEADGGFDEATSLAMSTRQHFRCPARLNMRDISELIFADRLVRALNAFLAETVTQCFNQAAPAAMADVANMLTDAEFADLARPPIGSPYLLDQMHNAICDYMDEVEEAAKDATVAGTDERPNRALRALAALSGRDRKYAAQCVLLVAVVNWFGLSPVAPPPQSPESTANSDSNAGSSSDSVPLLDRGLGDVDFDMDADRIAANTALRNSLVDRAMNDYGDSESEEAQGADLEPEEDHSRSEDAESAALDALIDSALEEDHSSQLEDADGAALDALLDSVLGGEEFQPEDASGASLAELLATAPTNDGRLPEDAISASVDAPPEPEDAADGSLVDAPPEPALTDEMQLDDADGAVIGSPHDSMTTDDDDSEIDLHDVYGHDMGPLATPQEPSGPRWLPLEAGLREFGPTANLQTLQIEVAGVARATFVALADASDSDWSDAEPEVRRIDPAGARRSLHGDSETEDGADSEADEGHMAVDPDMEPGRPVPPPSWSVDDRLAAMHGRGPFLFLGDAETGRDMPDLGALADGTRASAWAEQGGIVDGTIHLYDMDQLLEQGIVDERAAWRPPQPDEDGAARARPAGRPAFQALLRTVLYTSFGRVPPRRRWVPVALEQYAFYAICASVRHQLPHLPVPSVTDLMVQLTAYESRVEAVGRESGLPPRPLPHASGRWETTADLGFPALMAAVELYGKHRCGRDLRLGIISDSRTPSLDAGHPVTNNTLVVWIYHDGSARVHRDGTRTSHRYAALQFCTTHGRASHYMFAVRQRHFRHWDT